MSLPELGVAVQCDPEASRRAVNIKTAPHLESIQSNMEHPKVLVGFLLVSCLPSLAIAAGEGSKPKDGDKIQDKVTTEDSRYADRFSDAYVSDAWERTSNGWVRGGYQLVSGDSRTDVLYEVDPLGEMRVIARLPGQQQLARSKVHIGLPIGGAYRTPIYQRLHYFDIDGDGDFDDDDFDDDDLSFDDPADWDFSDDWMSSTKTRASRTCVGADCSTSGSSSSGTGKRRRHPK